MITVDHKFLLKEDNVAKFT